MKNLQYSNQSNPIMKSLLLLVFAVFTVTIVSAQSLSMDMNFSSAKMAGINVLKTSPGIVYGVGGSYLLSSNIKAIKSNFENLINAERANEGSINKQDVKYSENRFTLKGLLGYAFKNTTVTGVLGMGIEVREMYSTSLPKKFVQVQGFYTYKNNDCPVLLAGINVSQKVYKRLALNMGWNNIEKITFGISFRISPASSFK